MRYIILKGKSEVEVDIKKISENEYKITSQNKDHFVDFTKVSDGVFSIIIDGKSYEVSVTKENGGTYLVHMPDGGVRKIELLTPIEAILRRQGGLASKDNGEIRSPMPGRVVKIVVKEGQRVKEREGIVVVEAMKMQNQLTSPFDGIVKEIRVNEGEAVEKNGILAIVEKDGE